MGFSLGKKWLLFIMMLVLLAAGGFWYYYGQYLPAQASSPEETIKTARVRRGDLIITASGTGTLVPAAEVNLSFPSGGVLAELLVDVGDQVEAGDVLARLDDSDARLQVTQAEINLRLAELELAKLTKEPDAADLAAAQTELATAQAELNSLTKPPTAEELAAARENLLSAQQALKALLAGPKPEEIAAAKADLQLAEITLQEAQAAYDKIAWRPGASATSQAMELWQASTEYEKAKANYDLALAGPSEDEISAARAKVAEAQTQLNDLEKGPDPEDLAAAQAKVAQAQAQLDALLAGTSSEDLEAAQLNVEQARNDLASAQADLEDTVLKAPFSGIVTACEAKVGEMVSTSTIITLADLTHPLIELYLDETDLDKIAPGYEVQVTFDALPDKTFTGHVVRVDPGLVDMEGVPTVQALASLDLEGKQSGNLQFLPSGLNASVEVISGRAENVLLVPVEALRELSPGKYAVFVMVDGQLQVRPVEVGLMDYAYAEIISGLKEGEEVSTGIVEKK
ncbi:MAG: efflux RND transporter periplasmic adaptor subunit [Anaerolineae bacterium]